ncbi:MAG: hypothetical protein RL757_3096 [Bacteroidota bacterium]|jgi:glycosyltransferase involved in cell wall biosynthesis
MQSISVLFTTFNEAHNIEAALQSVSNWAAEIIVTDSFSDDKTVEIIEQFKEKTNSKIQIFQRKYEGPADQKNWTIPKSSHTWALLMDADERVTEAMKTEIDQILKSNNENIDAYWIGFQHYFMGRRVKYSGWQNDKTIRLIRPEKCRYNRNKVHEEIEQTNLQLGRLENKFEHFTFKDFRHFAEKQARYARWSAEDYAEKTPHVGYFHLFLKPFFRFFKHFFLKLGFLDGKIGFFIASVAAWSVFLRYAHIFENQRNKK